MRVKDLIIELSKCDPEALIVNDDYESGINEFRLVKPIVVSNMVVFYKKDEDRPSLYVRFDGECTVNDATLVNAVYLHRLDF